MSQTDDKLRDNAGNYHGPGCDPRFCQNEPEKAAATIDNLRVETERLREALEKVAFANWGCCGLNDEEIVTSMQDIARSALEGSK